MQAEPDNNEDVSAQKASDWKNDASVPVKVDELSYDKQKLDAEADEFSQASTLNFFLKHSYRDASRKKFHFALSFCSVYIVVWSALVINTLVDKGPIIFLKLAEGSEGQYDGIIYPSNDFSKMSEFLNLEGVFVNYTRVQEVTEN